MSDKNATSIGDILAGLKQTPELAKHFEEALIWERWPEVAGRSLMPHGRPVTVREGTLLIEVDSAVMMHKFSYRKEQIVRRVNRLIGRNLVSDVFLILAPEEKSAEPQHGG